MWARWRRVGRGPITWRCRRAQMDAATLHAITASLLALMRGASAPSPMSLPRRVANVPPIAAAGPRMRRGFQQGPGLRRRLRLATVRGLPPFLLPLDLVVVSLVAVVRLFLPFLLLLGVDALGLGSVGPPVPPVAGLVGCGLAAVTRPMCPRLFLGILLRLRLRLKLHTRLRLHFCFLRRFMLRLCLLWRLCLLLTTAFGLWLFLCLALLLFLLRFFGGGLVLLRLRRGLAADARGAAALLDPTLAVHLFPIVLSSLLAIFLLPPLGLNVAFRSCDEPRCSPDETGWRPWRWGRRLLGPRRRRGRDLRERGGGTTESRGRSERFRIWRSAAVLRI
mmetsp:Transcript_56266/g.156720  ORF Transcript_56266/g.156720 Transcript_56266/m.156720 type:complete len:335 (-) Transcript_56266:1247-2251(-)